MVHVRRQPGTWTTALQVAEVASADGLGFCRLEATILLTLSLRSRRRILPCVIVDRKQGI